MIPKTIHFIFGLQSDFAGKAFGFAHWAAIKSAARMNPGYSINYWHTFKPDNFYCFPNKVFEKKPQQMVSSADVIRYLEGVDMQFDDLLVWR
jgi:hypothetical protein